MRVWRIKVCVLASPKAALVWGWMEPAPAPNVPGNTEQQRMDYAVRKMFTVPKETVLQQEARQLAINRRKRALASKKRAINPS